jgi:predicted phage terminase large subunit-like protein
MPKKQPSAQVLIGQRELDAINKEIYSRSLAEFTKAAWYILEPVATLEWGWALDAICEHLEAVTAGKITRLLINVPPGCMKSLLTNVFWPAWEWGPKGMTHLRYLCTSYKQDLAIRDSDKTRRLIKSEWYQNYWNIELDKDSSLKMENTDTGFREAMAFSSLTGSRGDRVILDDPLSVGGANSQAELLTAERTFKEALQTRLNNSTKSAIIVIMQRLHQKDTSGIIIGDPDINYCHLMLPMRFEKERRCKTDLGFIDPRKEDGELLFPELFPEEAVREKESIMGTYAAAGQFQQRPTPRGGGIFKDAWWQYYTMLPPISYRKIYADTAQKTKEQNDYSVFQCWGWSNKTKSIYLLDQLRGKWEAPELLTKARAFWMKHKAVRGFGMLRKFCIEDKASGTGLIQQLRREKVFVEGIQRDKDKYIRGMDGAPVVEAGLVYLPQNAPFLSDLMDEFSTFPNGAFDDQVDPMLDAIADMIGGTSNGFSGANITL